jgi:hypothetical protein
MIAGMITVYVLIKLVLLAVAIGVGFLIHWIFPEVDFGIAILIGLLATLGTIQVFFGTIPNINVNTGEIEDESDEYPESEPIIPRIRPLRRPPARKRKPRRNP